MARSRTQATNSKALSLPETAFTRSGNAYFPRSDRWKIASLKLTINYDFEFPKSVLASDVVTSLKQVLMWYLSNYSSSHAHNIFGRFKNFLRFLGQDYSNISEITPAHILSYRSQLPSGRAWYLGVLSGFLKRWYSMGYSGVTSDVYHLLNELKIRGNAKGVAVSTMDPTDGPFDDMELQAIHAALNNALATSEIDIEDFVLVKLLSSLGVRPVQIAAMKCRDLMIDRIEGGLPKYILNVPRAKGRSMQIRTSFKPRPLSREVGEKLEAWINHVKKMNPVEADDMGELPIFPDWSSTGVAGFTNHTSALKLGNRVRLIFKELAVRTARSDKPLKVTPRRFRYTLGTRAAQEGYGELIIAELLDHSDTQSVGVYVEATPAIAERIDKSTALELAPVAQAFCGMIVEDEQHAKRGNDLTSRISGLDLSNVGTCGKFGFCGALAPVACYTCRNFQPWLDAPHEEVLETLIQERERLLDETGDQRVSSINDRTIVAVAEVCRQCQSILEQNEETGV